MHGFPASDKGSSLDIETGHCGAETFHNSDNKVSINLMATQVHGQTTTSTSITRLMGLHVWWTRVGYSRAASRTGYSIGGLCLVL